MYIIILYTKHSTSSYLMSSTSLPHVAAPRHSQYFPHTAPDWLHCALRSFPPSPAFESLQMLSPLFAMFLPTPAVSPRAYTPASDVLQLKGEPLGDPSLSHPSNVAPQGWLRLSSAPVLNSKERVYCLSPHEKSRLH